jgi:hypothetical protein
VAGSQWQNTGQPINWYRNDVQYFVDAGALSANVDHAAAAALVDAAAGVWNVAGVPFTLTDGGALSEDVSSANVYPGTSGPVWPADVQSSNYTAKQIAVVLDADGTITDMLLGSGASDPANCRQNAVTESVDLFIQPGKIAHALLLLNGRCTGSAPEQQLQMQYQLMRAFGRVIGIGWSQTNDNVFTGVPAATNTQRMHWPVMHPIDILCGPYTYQCMMQPFALRDDDVAAVKMLYQSAGVPPGTVVLQGTVTFPTGEGMNGLNVLAKRGYQWTNYLEDFADVSNVSGFAFEGDQGNPVTGDPSDLLGVTGSSRWGGYFQMTAIPSLPQFPSMDVYLNTEVINPLYIGAYAVGPYRMASVSASGSGFSMVLGGLGPGYYSSMSPAVVSDAANICNGMSDGTESSPSALPVGGVWSGRLCGVGHTAWSGLAVKAGHTATLEVTATDEQGLATNVKARPVMGVWHGPDATGTLPTMAATSGAMNTSHTGMTQLRVSFGTTEQVRFAIADQRGDGRPDYTYRARLLYADTVEPARMAAEGGAIRILGTGFAQGSAVTVGGVLATVTSVTSTEIDAIAPASAALGGASVNDVAVLDRTTGANTTISGGLTYNGASTDVLSMMTAPAASVGVGLPMGFALKVVDASGSAVANASVVVAVWGGGAVVNACALASCTLPTDASGVVQGSVVASSAGTVAMKASIKSGSAVSASWSVAALAQAVGFVRPVQYVAAGDGAVFDPAVIVTAGGAAAAGQSVVWSTGSSRLVLGAASSVAGADGAAIVRVTGSLRDGEAATLEACAWANVCATQSLTGVAASDLRVVVTAGDAQSVAAGGTLGQVSLRVVDAIGHPVNGAQVTVYQVVTGWQPPCAAGGRCAVAPVYGKWSTSLMSDGDGNVTVSPLQYADTAAVTTITATAGTQGEVTAVLQKTP